MHKERFWRWAILALFLVGVIVGPVLALAANTPLLPPAAIAHDTTPVGREFCSVAAGTDTVIRCRAATPTPVAGAPADAGDHGHLTVRGYSDALTTDEVARCMGMGRLGGSSVLIGPSQTDGARVIAVGVTPAGDAVIGRAYGPGDADIVAGLAHHWADGSLSTYLDTTNPFAPQYQADRVTDTNSTTVDSLLAARTVTDISVRQPYGIVVTDHHLTHLDADPTADVYAVQSTARLIPGAQAWPGSGYVTVATDITHTWADGARTNAVVDFVQPGDPTVGPTTLFGTYHPSDRANLSYIYRQSAMTSVPCTPATTAAHWSSTADTLGTAPVIAADELTPLSVATIRNGYTGPLATVSVKTRFHTLPLQPGGIDLIDESALTSTLTFQQAANP